MCRTDYNNSDTLSVCNTCIGTKPDPSENKILIDLNTLFASCPVPQTLDTRQQHNDIRLEYGLTMEQVLQKLNLSAISNKSSKPATISECSHIENHALPTPAPEDGLTINQILQKLSDSDITTKSSKPTMTSSECSNIENRFYPTPSRDRGMTMNQILQKLSDSAISTKSSKPTTKSAEDSDIQNLVHPTPSPEKGLTMNQILQKLNASALNAKHINTKDSKSPKQNTISKASLNKNRVQHQTLVEPHPECHPIPLPFTTGTEYEKPCMYEVQFPHPSQLPLPPPSFAPRPTAIPKHMKSLMRQARAKRMRCVNQ